MNGKGWVACVLKELVNVPSDGTFPAFGCLHRSNHWAFAVINALSSPAASHQHPPTPEPTLKPHRTSPATPDYPNSPSHVPSWNRTRDPCRTYGPSRLRSRRRCDEHSCLSGRAEVFPIACCVASLRELCRASSS